MDISIEFFPPRTPDGEQKLLTTANQLAILNPHYFSVTYGAGGSTQKGTMWAIESLKKNGFTVAPHLSCIGAERGQLRALLQGYRDLGVNRIVALRGDLPSGDHQMGDFRHAVQLVEFIRAEFGDYFWIEVAAYPEKHPQAESLKNDIDHLISKFKAGANAAITQYFYHIDAYFHLREALAKAGINAPLTPGIMPITSSTQLIRFSEMCGAQIPRFMRMQLADLGDDQTGIKAFGVKYVGALVRRLAQEGVSGVHFYSLNQSAAVLAIAAQMQQKI